MSGNFLFFPPEKDDIYRQQASTVANQVCQPGCPEKALLSGFQTITSQYSPSSYPSSPPPTYASAIQNTSPHTNSRSYGTLGDIKPKPCANTTKPALSSAHATTAFTCDAKSAEVYEYRDPRYGDQSKAFTNDSWSMSGTNPSGPIDPLAMYAELAGPTISGKPPTLTSNTTSIREVSELFGDLSFRAELPGSDTRPLPSYRKPEPNAPIPRKPMGSPHYPMFHADHSGDNKVLHELPSPSPARYEAPSFVPSELPGCVPNSFRPATSVPPADHRNTFTQTTGTTSFQTSVPQTQSASSARMRRQKTYMEMLGSLDPS